jgi:hypothetical protein
MEILSRVVRWTPRIAVVACLITFVSGVATSSQAGDGGAGPMYPDPNAPSQPGGPVNDTTRDTTHPTFVQ